MKPCHQAPEPSAAVADAGDRQHLDCRGKAATMPRGTAVSMNSFLQLSPRKLEHAFWDSPSAVKLLKASDLFCAANGCFMSLMLVRAFRLGVNSGLSWHYQLPMVMYAIMNVVQLLLLLVQPGMYQRHRFQLTLLNRLLRLLGVAWCVCHTGRNDMARMLGSADSEQRVVTGSFMRLLRCLLIPPMTTFNHANILLPFVFVLPAQLGTWAGNALVIRFTACLVAQQPDNLQLSQQLCWTLRSTMYNLSMLVGGPVESTQECGGVHGVVLLSLYADAVLLLVVPCVVVYMIEANLKVAFLRAQGHMLQHSWALMDSNVYKAVIVYASLVGCWMVCEVAVLLLSPLTCSADGLLH